MEIGVLAIQGSVIEHRKMLEFLGVNVTEIREPEDLKGIEGLIIPGGESTTMSKLMKRYRLFDELRRLIQSGLAVWGTCAGAILLAKNVTGLNPPDTLSVMDIEVERNGYGRQLDSFENKLRIKNEELSIESFNGIFIRAPKLKPSDSNVSTLAETDGESVMLQQKNMLVTSFHPELTDDPTVHRYFLEMCRKQK